jgi:hypothetical protein
MRLFEHPHRVGFRHLPTRTNRRCPDSGHRSDKSVAWWFQCAEFYLLVWERQAQFRGAEPAF